MVIATSMQDRNPLFSLTYIMGNLSIRLCRLAHYCNYFTKFKYSIWNVCLAVFVVTKPGDFDLKLETSPDMFLATKVGIFKVMLKTT